MAGPPENRGELVVRFLSCLCLSACFLALPAPGRAQSSSAGAGDGGGFWQRWFERSEAAKATQPHWITPVATTTPRLEQEFRYDVTWSQAQPGAAYAESFGGGKGLELIPFHDVEIIVGLPSYVMHNDPARPDGWSDFQLVAKYRLLSTDEQHGGYILTAFLGSNFPTGTNGNGLPSAVVTPTLAYGKGWGAFDVQGTIGAAEPTAHTAAIGRTYTWNHTFQYHALTTLWPEVEVNQSWFAGGKHDGKAQTFVTPGVVIGKLPLTRAVGLTLGAGVQIATSRFHTADHTIIVSSRLPF